MPASDPAFAMLVRGGEAIRIRKGDWSEEIPVAKLDGRIALYRSLVKRANGQHAKHHQPTLDALVKVRAKIEEKNRGE